MTWGLAPASDPDTQRAVVREYTLAANVLVERARTALERDDLAGCERLVRLARRVHRAAALEEREPPGWSSAL